MTEAHPPAPSLEKLISRLCVVHATSIHEFYHLAFKHWVEINDHIKHQATELSAAKEELAKAREVISMIAKVAADAPELNMGNYDEDQVSALNNAMIEICQIIPPDTLYLPTSAPKRGGA